ncbi:MAG: UDP-3-O-[3-hydroxymyristoyl] N-acetylglucosamine deacetylase [Pirellulaceae bacterium]|nr:UDP-3-O-[3-hydroxymyristoyl] N-acetylglucosamine deacetylase [Pirellulaceae bacterium]
MKAQRYQQTISRRTTLTGYGFWSGLDVTVEFRPAPCGHGVVFIRRDLPGMPVIPATVDHLAHGPRRTTLSRNGTAVDMVEHILAALTGLKIDNCQVWVDRAEMPGFDGSSLPFAQVLSQVGIVRQTQLRSRLTVDQVYQVGDENSWVRAEPNPSGTCELTYLLSYPDEPAIGEQTFGAQLETVDFLKDVAPARTFVTRAEAESLRQQGLGRRVNYHDILVFENAGPINNQLRFVDECARHKLLDMIGDFALAGCDLVGKFTAYRSGHRLNGELVRQLKNRFTVQAEHRKTA